MITRRHALAVGGGALGLAGLSWATATPAAATPAAATSGTATPAATLTTVWPTRRGDGEEIVRRYGRRGRLIGELLHVGDPLGDAVVKELDRLGAPARTMLSKGISRGLSSLADPPPAIAAYLRYAETVPEWVTQRTYTGGSDTFMSIPLPAHAQALALASLTHTYSSPAIAKVLVGTGELINSTQRRLVETTDWVLRCMLPDGLRPGGQGYVATLQVRVLHAQARARTLRAGWDTGALGHPISQVDLARTWLDFLPIAYAALERLGNACTPDEIADLYRTWWYVGYLLGIDPRLYLGITDHDSARTLLNVVDATNEAPSPLSKALVTATVEATANLFSTVGVLPPISKEFINATFRVVNGDPISDLYGIRKSALSAVVLGAAEVSRGTRALARPVPFAWETQRAANLVLVKAFLGLIPPSGYTTKYVDYNH